MYKKTIQIHFNGTDDQREGWLQFLGGAVASEHANVIESGKTAYVVCFADADEDKVMDLISKCGFLVISITESNPVVVEPDDKFSTILV